MVIHFEEKMQNPIPLLKMQFESSESNTYQSFSYSVSDENVSYSTLTASSDINDIVEEVKEREIVSKIATAKKVYYTFDSSLFESKMGVDFDTLYTKYDASFKSYIKKNYKNLIEHEIEEIIGNAWDRIMYHYGSYDEQYNLKTWLYRVCINAANMYLTSANKKHISYVDSNKLRNSIRVMKKYSMDPYRDDPKYKEDRAVQIVNKVREAILKIDNEECKTIMEMWVIEGMTLLEISEETGINLSTVKAKVSKSKEMLKRILGDNIKELIFD